MVKKRVKRTIRNARGFHRNPRGVLTAISVGLASFGVLALSAAMVTRVQVATPYPTVAEALQHGEAYEYLPGLLLGVVAGCGFVMMFALSLRGIIRLGQYHHPVWMSISILCLIVSTLVLLLLFVPVIFGIMFGLATGQI